MSDGVTNRNVYGKLLREVKQWMTAVVAALTIFETFWKYVHYSVAVVISCRHTGPLFRGQRGQVSYAHGRERVRGP